MVRVIFADNRLATFLFEVQKKSGLNIPQLQKLDQTIGIPHALLA